MGPSEVIATLEKYEQEISSILARFNKTSDALSIAQGDHGRYKEMVLELRDFFKDEFVEGQEYTSPLISYFNDSTNNYYRSPSFRGVENVRGVVSAALTRARRNPSALRSIHLENVASGGKDAGDLFKIIERIHLVIQQMRKRHDGRPTLDVVDEYDLQDVVHALLRLSFDDVREEEWVPSYAGSSSRADFLLPELESVLELKMMRATMSTKQLGEQLIVDIAKYKKHPQCRTLYCLVYDPDGRISNPRGVESDLNGKEQGIEVRVIIVPKGT